MKQDDINRWKSEVLDVIFEAIALNDTLRFALNFKGARVLNRRLNADNRQSLDIDSNLSADFVRENPDRLDQERILGHEIRLALIRYFDAQDPVRLSLQSVKIRRNPPQAHPRKWDAFEVVVKVTDSARATVQNLPPLVLDIASPETIGINALAPLFIGRAGFGHEVQAYTLQRIAGEKLRAFLSTLPAYRRKICKPGDAVRVKDLYDLCRIERHTSISETGFWMDVGHEFRLACASRFVDCAGLSTFEEALMDTESAYVADKTLDITDIGFNEAHESLRRIVGFLETHRFTPLSFPLPPTASQEQLG